MTLLVELWLGTQREQDMLWECCFPDNCKNGVGTPKMCVKVRAVQCLASGCTGMCDTGMFPCVIATECGWEAQGACGWVVEVVF